MNPESKVFALLATARTANVPSVVSNLAVGVCLAGGLGSGEWDWPWLLTLAVVLFYVSGNFLNDWWDREWDVENRPERALPRGLFSSGSYLVVAVLGMVAGLGLVVPYGIPAVIVAAVLVFFILLYTFVHKTAAWSVVPMGMCRACLPVIGFLAVQPRISGEVFFPAGALLLYIIALSLSARWESKGGGANPKSLWAGGLLFGSGLVASLGMVFVDPRIGWIGLFPFLVWLGICLKKYRAPVSAHVSALLAGIPLVDWLTLLPLAVISMVSRGTGISEPFFLVAVLLPPVAFVCGRLLQRVAPAT